MVTRQNLFARAAPVELGVGGRLIWLLVLLVASFSAWATWASLEEQIRAPGKIIVSSRSQVVQAVDGGVLSRLNVREGQTVAAGEIIAELDPVRFAASAGETRARVRNLRANIKRLSAELAGRALTFGPEFDVDPDLIRTQKNLHARRLQQQREQARSIRQSLAIAGQELDAVEALAATGDAARSEVLQARRQVNELQGELTNTRNEHRRQAQQQLASAQDELDQAEQVLKQRNEALQATEIRAPMSGTVKNVEVTTLGAVLGPGDEILQIVPSDDPLIVEARVSSADVAFLRPGLKANVKLDAYDFTIYGALRGEVTYVSPDTIDEDLQRDEEPYYRVLIQVDEPAARSAREPIDIIPGMVTTVEIITGNRTVAQYLLKPLLRSNAAALTER